MKQSKTKQNKTKTKTKQNKTKTDTKTKTETKTKQTKQNKHTCLKLSEPSVSSTPMMTQPLLYFGQSLDGMCGFIA